MALFSELATKLTLDNKQFIAGLGQAEAAVKGFSATGATAFKGISLLAGGTLIAGVSALGMAIKSTADKFDDLGDAAENLGIGVEQFQALSYAADQFGSSTEQLTGLLNKMGKTIGDAANGNKSAIEAFDRIGLSLKDLLGLSPDEQLKKIGAAIKEIGDRNLQAADASAIFGKQGSKNLTLLTSNLEEVTQKAKEMGQVLSEENTKKLGELSDKLKELGKGFSATFGGLLASAKPVLDLLINRFTDILNIINKIINTGKNLGGFVKDLAGYGPNYDPNADNKKYKPMDLSQFDPDNIARRVYGVRMTNAPSDIAINARKGLQENAISKTLDISFEKLSSAADKAKTSVEDFANRMDQLGDLRNNRYDDYKGRRQLESEDFDNIARDLIDKQLSGNLTTEEAKSGLDSLRGITEDHLQLNEKGNIEEFSTASLKNDLKQLTELLLGNKGKAEITVSVDSSPEFEAKILKISEDSFISILTKEAVSVNR